MHSQESGRVGEEVNTLHLIDVSFICLCGGLETTLQESMQISGLTFRCCIITEINHHLFSSVSATSSRSSCLYKMSASNSSWDDNSPAGVISGSVSSNFTLALLLDNCNWYFIKGQCHEIFNIRFFSWIVFPTAPYIQFAPFQKYSKLVKILKTCRRQQTSKLWCEDLMNIFTRQRQAID